MKLVLLLYLEGDGPAVTKLLLEQGISAYSRLPIEGLGVGKAGGWYGDIATHTSKMIFAVVSDEEADSLLGAVKEVKIQDTGHHIHLAKLKLEDWVQSTT